MARAGGLEVRLHDPKTHAKKELSIVVDYNQLLHDYYEPIQALIAASAPSGSIGNAKLFRFDAGDFSLGLHPIIEQALQTQSPEALINRFDNRRGLSRRLEDLHAGPDGIIIVPGRSWPIGLEQAETSVRHRG